MRYAKSGEGWDMSTRPIALKIVRQRAGIRHALAAATQYATNHIINEIPLYFVRHAWYRGVLGWDLGPDTAILMGQVIQFRGVRSSGRRVSIDRGTTIGSRCFLSTAGGLVIGQHVYLSPGVWLVTGLRDPDDPQFKTRYLPIVIDDFACIGARATILGGITIGTGAVVRAGSVVLEDVEPFAIVEGVPARVVGRRSLTDFSYRLTPGPLFG
jgi:acetyltransferase-like isoleucine patch superfamily enzyme